MSPIETNPNRFQLYIHDVELQRSCKFTRTRFRFATKKIIYKFSPFHAMLIPALKTRNLTSFAHSNDSTRRQNFVVKLSVAQFRCAEYWLCLVTFQRHLLLLEALSGFHHQPVFNAIFSMSKSWSNKNEQY